jgi:hypothetical protein
MSTLEQTFNHSQGCVSRIFDLETVVILPQTGQVVVLNEVGSIIWKLIDGNRDVNEIVKVICEQYNVEKEQAERDVSEFIEKLLIRGMLVVSSQLE